ncbi:MAG: hypothetical protein DHS80DRAFT_24234 [Piptocephalis tieghemiana]|nr:MAG: hypothetical protein DHS80DRAFT_24234 [Piptocephalis tieghemiana]
MQLLAAPTTLLALAVLLVSPLTILAQNEGSNPQIPQGFDPSQMDSAAASSLLAEASASGISEFPTGEVPTGEIPTGEIPTAGPVDPSLNGTVPSLNVTEGTNGTNSSATATATTTPLPTSTTSSSVTSTVTSHPTSTPGATAGAAPGSLLDHVALMVLSVPVVIAAANAL